MKITKEKCNCNCENSSGEVKGVWIGKPTHKEVVEEQTMKYIELTNRRIRDFDFSFHIINDEL